MGQIPTLVTERLVLRPPSPGDLDDFLKLGNDPEVMRYIGHGAVLSASQSAIWLETILAHARHGFPHPKTPKGLPGVMVVIDRESGSFVGLAMLSLLNPSHVQAIGSELCPDPPVEVGYRLARQCWGRGYATELGVALVRYGFEELGLGQIAGIADVRNAASNRVLDKLGLPIRTTYELDGIRIHFHCSSLAEWSRRDEKG